MRQASYTSPIGLPSGRPGMRCARSTPGEAASEGGYTFDIHRPYEVGTEISPQGRDTFRSVIIELEESRVYADAPSSATCS
jgi:hypothetical protein